MSTTTPTTHLLLPGQTAAPAGEVDMNGMYVLHHAFRRDLGRFAAAVAATPITETGTWTLLRDRWERFAAHLHEHHSKEDDVLWPLLEQRSRSAGDVEALDVLAAMEAEHEVIDPALHACQRGFALLATGPDEDAQVRLEVDLAALRGALVDHLGHEESAAVVVVQRYLGGAEWAEIERTEFRGRISMREMAFLVPWMFDGLPEHDADELRRMAGPVLGLLHALTRRGYARREARTFSHAR